MFTLMKFDIDIFMKARNSSLEDDATSSGSNNGKRKKKILIKKRKGADKPSDQSVYEYPTTSETVTKTYPNLSHDLTYYDDGMDDQIVRNESGPSGSKSTTYYVTEQPSDNEDIVETYQTQAFTDGDDSNLEIISIADDDPQYSTITTEV